MNFEFDPTKSLANKAKHGIDFHEAQGLWSDEDGITGPGLVHDLEERWVRVAAYRGRIWAAAFTMRGESIRIISVRAARDDEKEIYEFSKG